MGTMWKWGKYNVLLYIAASHEVCRHYPCQAYHASSITGPASLHNCICTLVGSKKAQQLGQHLPDHLLNMPCVEQFMRVMCHREFI